MDTLDFPAIVQKFENASTEMLAAVLDQSIDCIKVIGPSGSLDYMNRNGRCAMEIDDFALVAGKTWWDLWPAAAQPILRDAMARARSGESSRFEEFCPTAKGSPRWWDVAVSPLRDRWGGFQGVVSISRDITERVESRELRKTTSEEMRHRLQNAYALIGAMVTATARGSRDREEFASEIVDRLQSLGIAQTLLLDPGSLGKPNLDVLVRRLTEPFCGNGCRLVVEGIPDVALDERQVRVLALVIGEFSTNSNKYGALGHGGSIAIDGNIDGGVLTLHWSETSNAPVTAHDREGGAGLALIRRALGVRQGSLGIDWRADGLDAAVQMPGF